MGDLELGYTPHNLRVLIERSGQTQKAVADALGVGLRTLQNWMIADLGNSQHRDMPLVQWQLFLKTVAKTC